MATSRPSRGSCARYTSPCHPHRAGRRSRTDRDEYPPKEPCVGENRGAIVLDYFEPSPGYLSALERHEPAPRLPSRPDRASKRSHPMRSPDATEYRPLAELCDPGAGRRYPSSPTSRPCASSSEFVGLAEAFPQDKYTWRPMEGGRSVSEVLMLIASRRRTRVFDEWLNHVSSRRRSATRGDGVTCANLPNAQHARAAKTTT